MSTTIDRTVLITGAGAVTFSSATLLTPGQIVARVNQTEREQVVAGYGTINRRIQDNHIRVTFPNHGFMSAAILAALCPTWARNPSLGTSLLASTDAAAVINGMDGKKVTIHNAILSRLPSLYLGADKGVFEDQECEILGLLAKTTARTNAAALYTQASEAWAKTITQSDYQSCGYTALWGTGPGQSILAEKGWTVSCDLNLDVKTTADVGSYDVRIMGATWRARCQPYNLDETVWTLQLHQGTGAAVGSTTLQSKDLVITADAVGGVNVTLHDASWLVGDGRQQWGTGVLRVGEIGFVANRKFNTGVPGEMVTIAIKAA
ncbi:MAG TPA: hypothetical protein P5069_11690 [Candidatus Hydrogenedentes bacterium]|nr:hypothetical protein [Candidatus Hydrogenedentota bacterium]